ncbi:MAG TPA: hypothetical protein VK576_05475 [Thermoleophilia bacterium]|nr:hypothetical protein [Thermoleophilia bacterium]
MRFGPTLRTFAVAAVAGFAFGAADQYLGSRAALGAWAPAVSTTSAPWLVLPFVAGCTQVRSRRAMLIGLVTTMAALAGYFALMWSPLEGVAAGQVLPHLPALLGTQWLNIVGGLVTAPLFGLLGQRWRVRRSWLAAALVVAALCLEPFARLATGRLWGPPVVSWLEALVGALFAAYFVFERLSRDRRLATRP